LHRAESADISAKMLTKRLFALLLLWFQLLLQVWAGGQAGGLEKIYLWGCYNIAWAQFGPTQGEILKRSGKKYTGSVNSNWGKYDPDGKLSFGEFMDALTGREYGTCTVPEPAPGKAAQLSAQLARRQEGFDRPEVHILTHLP
jgi:hypothetical protein